VVEVNELISVIVPIHIYNDKIIDVRESILKATKKIEIIYVVDKNVKDFAIDKNKFEKIIHKQNIGRGFMLAEGIAHSKGDIILFLHSDSILPEGWDEEIRRIMSNESNIGGGFDLKFDYQSTYLNLALKILTYRIKKSKILSGDRALFVRSSLIKDNIKIFNIPIMEDIELSKLMKENGRVELSNKFVITSAYAFKKYGILRQTIRIFFCYFWYKVGGNIQDIYNFYYSKN
jgi:glycosyltransferase involved in cell wall biosynthesis